MRGDPNTRTQSRRSSMTADFDETGPDRSEVRRIIASCVPSFHVGLLSVIDQHLGQGRPHSDVGRPDRQRHRHAVGPAGGWKSNINMVKLLGANLVFAAPTFLELEGCKQGAQVFSLLPGLRRHSGAPFLMMTVLGSHRITQED